MLDRLVRGSDVKTWCNTEIIGSRQRAAMVGGYVTDRAGRISVVVIHAEMMHCQKLCNKPDAGNENRVTDVSAQFKL